MLHRVANWLRWRKLPYACPSPGWLTQGAKSRLMSKYCNKPSTALAHAATSHASATVRRRCVSVCASAAHHNSAALAQAQLSKYGNTVELGPLVNGLSHGKTSSGSVATGASKAGLGRGCGGDGAFTGADYRGATLPIAGP